MCRQDGYVGEYAYTEEQKLVIEKFKEGFFIYKDKPIVLYGLGKNTEAVLEALKDFRFEGLMDVRRTGENCFGLKVLSEEEVKKLNPIIVIIARDSVQGIIYRRIRHLYDEARIHIFSYLGTELTGQEYHYANEGLPYWDTNERMIRRAICESEVISFDIFDTLVMRKVLEPEDIFYLTERRWNKRKGDGSRLPFHNMRMQAERSLTACPTIEDIYDCMGKMFHLGKNELEELRCLEFQTEQECLICREPVRNLMQYAIKLGKPVYLLSDMYYTSKQLEELLEPHGIHGYERIFVSCELGKDKESGALYDIYRQYIGSKKALHIGDNRRADIEPARGKDITPCQVYSAQELMAASNIQELLSNVENFQQKLLLGMFAAKAFRDPFVLSKTKGNVRVDSLFEAGYLYFGPIFSEIALWLEKEVEKGQVDQLLFPSRDGYLMKKLYRQLGKIKESHKDGSHGVPSVYFRTSRRASSVAAIRSNEDICFLIKRKFNGTNEDFLWQRFGIRPFKENPEGQKPVKVGQSLENYILSYAPEILRNAKMERERYLDYLTEKGVGGNKKEALFDFVAGGTVQYYLEKLLCKKLKGVYAATINLPNDLYCLEDGICAAYGNFSTYGTSCALGKYYLILEPVMMDDQATFMRFSDDGQEEYCGMANVNGKEIRMIQEGILAFARDWYSMRKLSGLWEGCLKKADEILEVLFTRCQASKEIRGIFQNDDEYDGIKQYVVWGEES